jgi:hypothetical protein
MWVVISYHLFFFFEETVRQIPPEKEYTKIEHEPDYNGLAKN